MSSTSDVEARAGTPVLCLNSGLAEWFEVKRSGEVAYGVAPLEGTAPADVAAAALAAIENAGARPKSCVLALGGGLVEQRFLTLPSLSGAELRDVLLRKAAAHLDTSQEDTLFAAKPFKVDAEGGRQTWLLLSMKRSIVGPLRLALRDRGLSVQRVVPARFAAVSEVHARREDREGACIVVAVEPRAVSVSLIVDETLLNQNVLEGSVVENPQMAAVLIQEVKSYEAHWRKESRGSFVAQVAIVGLGRERGELLSAALRNAVQETDVRLYLGREDHPEAGRCEMLEACLYRGPYSVDLAVPLPFRKLASALVLAMMAVLTLTVGLVTKRDISERLVRLESEAQEVLRRTDGLDGVERDLASARADVAALEEALGSVLETRELGMPLAGVLADAFGAFQGRAHLLSLSVARSENGGAVSISGVTDPNPIRAFSFIDAITDSLEESARFEDVRCTPSSRIPTAGGGREQAGRLEFDIEARREERP